MNEALITEEDKNFIKILQKEFFIVASISHTFGMGYQTDRRDFNMYFTFDNHYSSVRISPLGYKGFLDFLYNAKNDYTILEDSNISFFKFSIKQHFKILYEKEVEKTKLELESKIKPVQSTKKPHKI